MLEYLNCSNPCLPNRRWRLREPLNPASDTPRNLNEPICRSSSWSELLYQVAPASPMPAADRRVFAGWPSLSRESRVSSSSPEVSGNRFARLTPMGGTRVVKRTQPDAHEHLNRPGIPGGSIA